MCLTLTSACGGKKPTPAPVVTSPPPSATPPPATTPATLEPEAKADVAPEPSPGAAPTEAMQMVADWMPRPRLAAHHLMLKYGPPTLMSKGKLVWHKVGPYKRIAVMNEEIHHDFPRPHADFMTHTVSYDVPATRLEMLTMFDGSATYDRTAGELSGRCDLEGHNILTLNIANDLLSGKLDVAQARAAFNQNVIDDTLGKDRSTSRHSSSSQPQAERTPTSRASPARPCAWPPTPRRRPTPR